MADCIFCKIVAGEIPCSKVYEDADTFAFLDISPVNKGHTLVIPKEHHETLLDIPEDLLSKVAVTLKKVATAVKKGVGCPGLSIGQSNFREGGQVVPHLHFHVMPRLADDGLKFWPQKKYEEGEAEEYRKRIKGVLK